MGRVHFRCQKRGLYGFALELVPMKTLVKEGYA